MLGNFAPVGERNSFRVSKHNKNGVTMGDLIGGGWLLCIRVWVGAQGVGVISWVFFISAFILWSLLVSHVLSLFLSE